MNLESADLLQVSLILVTYAAIMRILVLIVLLPLTALGSGIYTRDGVTDGDTFYLAPYALTNDDPVLQSWVSYSLTKSACQLELGGDNPARNSSFSCELTAREHLLETWVDQRLEHQGAADSYLDSLLRVHDAGFLEEYVVRYFGQRDWQVPPVVQTDRFRAWQRENLRRHKPVTRIIGSWNYRLLKPARNK